MEKKYKIFLILSLVLLTYCTFTITNVNKHEPQSSPLILAERFKTLKEIKYRAPEILEVTVIDTLEPIEYGEAKFTISNTKVVSRIKGSIKEGEEINILEPGFSINGSNMIKGETYILFLEKYVGPITDNAFVIIGVHQGKFIIKNGEAVQQAPDDNKLTDYNHGKREAFIKKIDEIE